MGVGGWEGTQRGNPLLQIEQILSCLLEEWHTKKIIFNFNNEFVLPYIIYLPSISFNPLPIGIL